MQLYLTREGLSSKTLPLAAARQIADHCGVTEPLHLNLLQAVLGELDVRRLQSTFAREGFFVEVDPNGMLIKISLRVYNSLSYSSRTE